MPVIPVTHEMERRKIIAGGKLRQSVSKTLSQPIKAGVVGHACHPSYLGNVGRRITVQASPDRNWRPHLKNN
jgi:hypothetical protein